MKQKPLSKNEVRKYKSKKNSPALGGIQVSPYLRKWHQDDPHACFCDACVTSYNGPAVYIPLFAGVEADALNFIYIDSENAV